jgi:hypothetical protein
LRALKRRAGSKLALFSAHDPVELAQFREYPPTSADERLARSAP